MGGLSGFKVAKIRKKMMVWDVLGGCKIREVKWKAMMLKFWEVMGAKAAEEPITEAMMANFMVYLSKRCYLGVLCANARGFNIIKDF